MITFQPHFSKGNYFGNNIGQWNGFLDVISKVSKFTIQYFTILQNLGLLMYAAKQFVFDYLPGIANKTEVNEETLDYRFQDVAKKHFDSVQTIKTSQSLELCILYGTSGVFGLAAALGEQSLIDLGASLPFVSCCGWVSFLFGCLRSLDRNIEIYQEACEMESVSFGEERELAERIKVSAILGILSDLSYTAITICSIFSGPLAICILLGCLAIFFISLQNIYNFFYLNMQFPS